MKKVLAAIVCLAMILSLSAFAFPSNAATEGDFVYEVVDGSVAVTAYTGADSNVIFPATLGGLPVTAIGDVFVENTVVTSVTIPDSVTYISESCLIYCRNNLDIYVDEGNAYYSSVGGVLFNKAATEIISYPSGKTGAYTIPDGVTEIGGSAFDGCTGLTSLTIPDSAKYINSRLDSFCTALTEINVDEGNAYYSSVGGVLFNKDMTTLIICPEGKTGAYTIPDGVTEIGGSAFDSCTALTSVTIPDSVNEIGNHAFFDCTALASITISDSVKSIAEAAFDNTAFYNDDANWEDGVLYIGKYLYEAKTNISGTYTIKDGTVSICYEAFFDCRGLTSIIMPDSVTSIGDKAFTHCANITSVIISDGLTEIGQEAFSSCTKLVSTTIPDVVTTIGEYAFSDCSALDSVFIFSEDCIISDEARIPTTATVYGYAGSTAQAYATAKGNTFAVISVSDIAVSTLPTKTSYVLGEEFSSDGLVVTANYSNGSNENVTAALLLPDMTTVGTKTVFVTYMGRTASFEITVDYTPEDHFLYLVRDGKAKLLSYKGSSSYVAIPPTLGGYAVTLIDSNAFRNYTEITSIIIPYGVTEICYYAFSDCTGLTTVIIPDSVTEIGEYAFFSCTGLTEITIPDGVTKISTGMFNNCTELTTVSIPDRVTEIGNDAFFLCESLTSITIPDSVTKIGVSAFGYCEKITSITIPDGVIEIGLSAFCGCTGLTSITIPNGVTSIGDYVFQDCTALESIEIPNGVTSIGDDAFRECSALASIVIPDSVTHIGPNAFQNTAYFADDDNWSYDGVLYIGRNLYAAKEGISGEYTVDDGTVSICDNAFSACTDLASIIIPDGVTEINYSAFYNCTALSSIEIPDSVTIVGEHAFDNTAFYNDDANWENGVLYIGKNLYKAKEDISGEYTVKDGTVSIGGHAFSNCTALTSTVIPESVTGIGGYVFEDCSALGSIYVFNPHCDISQNAHIPTATTIYGFAGSTAEAYATAKGNTFVAVSVSSLTVSTLPTKTLYVIGEGLDTTGLVVTASYSSGYSGTVTADVSLPDMTTAGTKTVAVTLEGRTATFEITVGYTAEDLFTYSVDGDKATVTYYTGSSVYVAIPQTLGGYTVTGIGTSAFYYNMGIVSIVMPDSVTSIGDYAFSFCMGLASVEMPGVTSIGNNAFYVCTELASITIPDGVTLINSNTFNSCEKLVSITIPRLVTTIGDNAFGNCTSLNSVELVYGLESIESNAFSGCRELTSITIPDSVTGLGDNSFGSCEKLTSITIPDSVTKIGNNAFICCSGLNSVTIENGVTEIGDDAFRECSALASIVIPDSVESIGSSAFRGCTSLSSIVIPDSVTDVGNGAFYDTAYYSDSANWEDGVLYIGKTLYSANADTVSGAYVISDGTVTVCGSAFFLCTNLTSITIPDSVKRIGDSVFNSCSGLTSITIPQSVKSIGHGAFYDCTALGSVYIYSASCDISSEVSIPTATTVYGFAGSTSQAYAIANGNTFVAFTPSSITVTTLPTKTEYSVGDSFSSEGIVVTASLDNGIAEAVTADVSLPDMTTAGTKTVTVTYGGKTATFEITVSEPQALAGDVDGDGSVTTSDARRVLLYALGDTSVFAEEYLEAADYKDDGEINTADARLVLLAALGQ